MRDVKHVFKQYAETWKHETRKKKPNNGNKETTHETWNMRKDKLNMTNNKTCSNITNSKWNKK